MARLITNLTTVPTAPLGTDLVWVERSGAAYKSTLSQIITLVQDSGATNITGGAAGELLYQSGSGVTAKLAAGATTQILVGGGAAAPVWTTATGTGAPVRAGSPTFTGTVGAAAITATGVVQGAGVTSTADVTAASNFVSSTTSAIVATTGAGTVYLRPNGKASTTGQASINSTGTFFLDVGGGVASASPAMQVGNGASEYVGIFGKLGAGSYNGIVQVNDKALIAFGGSSGAATFCLTTWSGTACGVRITSTGVTVTGTTIGLVGATTFTSGDVTVDRGATAGGLFLNANSGVVSDLRWYTANSVRWIARCDNATNSGSNVGSDWSLSARDDAGNALFTCIAIVRSTGAMTVRKLTSSDTITDLNANVRDLKVVSKTAGFTLALTDLYGQLFVKTNSTAFSATLPPNSSVAIPVNSVVQFMNQGGTTNNLTVARGAGVTLYNAAGTNGDIALTPGQSVTVIKIATDTWQVLT